MSVLRPSGLQFPDTSHLAPEDAELLKVLYWERNAISRSEYGRVRKAVNQYRQGARPVHAESTGCAETALPESA